MSSTATGWCSGPLAAKPTNAAMSMRTSVSLAAGDTKSNLIPGSGSVKVMVWLLQLHALVGQNQLFHGYIRALGVERPEGTLVGSGILQSPGKNCGGMVFTAQRDL